MLSMTITIQQTYSYMIDLANLHVIQELVRYVFNFFT